MKVLQAVSAVEGASGIVTFVRRLDGALREAGVGSRILTGTDPLPDRLEADVVHIHGLWLPFVHRVALRARRQGVPVVWSTHGMTAPWSMRNRWFKKVPAWWLYQRRDLRGAALVHATSEREVEWNRRLGLTRACVVPLGTDLPSVPPPERSGTAGHTLLFVGRLHPVKALDRLITAFARVPEPVRAGWTLRLVGPEEDRAHAQSLKTLVADLGLAGVCTFAGARFGEALAAEYAACDALALVSHTENFGATVVDALAYGKPVVTGTRTPWAHVAAAGCGWWTDNDPAALAEALGALMRLTDADRAERGRRGRALVEAGYTWPAVARAMREAYASLV